MIEDIYQRLEELARWLNDHHEDIRQQRLTVSLSVENDEGQRIVYSGGDAFTIIDMSMQQQQEALKRLNALFCEMCDELPDDDE